MKYETSGPEGPTVEREFLSDLAHKSGIELLCVSPLELPPEDERLLGRWQDSQFCGTMRYMQRPAAQYTVARELMPRSMSLISFAFFYEQGPVPAAPSEPCGRVARYAWGKDYHRVLKRRLRLFDRALRDHVDFPFESKILCDAVPLLERAFAREAGLGSIGKNSMLIRQRGEGSFFFLAEMLFSFQVLGSEQKLPQQRGRVCGSCVRCLKACPTGAFEAPYILDARKCISYLTIEKRDSFSEEQRQAIGAWIFGCDVCQEVCPYNAKTMQVRKESSIPELSARYGRGAWLPLRAVLAVRTHENFVQSFAGTALMRAKREGLLRNACCVAANIGAESLLPALEVTYSEDPSPLVRQHALWAIWSLAKRGAALSNQRLDRILARGAGDSVPLVADEARRLQANR